MDKKRKEYLKNWWKNNPEKRRQYEKTYKLKHPDKIKAKEVRRRKNPKYIEYRKGYTKVYLQRQEPKRKHYIRSRTNKKYGKTPKGYEKHHLDYDSPDNFIILPIEEHREIHAHNL